MTELVLLLLGILSLNKSPVFGFQQDKSINILTKLLLELMNTEIRQEMVAGVPLLGIPPLDPGRIPSLPVEWGDVKKSHIVGQMTDTDLIGLSDFIITQLNIDLNNDSILFDLTFPRLVAKGHYAMTGKLMRVFDVAGDGDFVIDVTDLVVNATANLTIDDHVIQIKAITLNGDFNNVTAKFDNLFGGGRLNKAFNSIVTHYGRFIFTAFKPHLMKKLERFFKVKINSWLEKVDFDEMGVNLKFLKQKFPF